MCCQTAAAGCWCSLVRPLPLRPDLKRPRPYPCLAPRSSGRLHGRTRAMGTTRTAARSTRVGAGEGEVPAKRAGRCQVQERHGQVHLLTSGGGGHGMAWHTRARPARLACLGTGPGGQSCCPRLGARACTRLFPSARCCYRPLAPLPPKWLVLRPSSPTPGKKAEKRDAKRRRKDDDVTRAFKEGQAEADAQELARIQVGGRGGEEGRGEERSGKRGQQGTRSGCAIAMAWGLGPWHAAPALPAPKPGTTGQAGCVAQRAPPSPPPHACMHHRLPATAPLLLVSPSNPPTHTPYTSPPLPPTHPFAAVAARRPPAHLRGCQTAWRMHGTP